VLTAGAKTKRTVIVDDDDSDVYMPDPKEAEVDDDVESISAAEPTPSVSSAGTSPEPAVRKKPSNLSRFDASTPLSSSPAPSSSIPKLSAGAVGAFGKPVNKEERVKNFVEKNKDRYSWLLDLRDKEGNRPGEESYDPRTIYIPNSAWKNFTAFEKQYW
jgi:DNA mismatch repair protein MSH6